MLFRSKSGDVERIFNMVIEEYPDDFQFLTENAIFQFTTRQDPTYDDDGNTVAATAHKLSNRERDLYGSDFEICVYMEYWETLVDEQKKRLIYHELLHCWVEPDPEDDSYPKYDKDERVVTGILPHDLVVKTFKAEIEQFGLDSGDLELAEFFHAQYEEYLAKRKQKMETKTGKAGRRR